MNFPKLDPREEHFFIPGPHAKLKLFLRYLPSLHGNNTERPPVLYVHGATFPSALSIAHRFEGFSWRDALNEVGFDVWAVDLYGFGYSDRYDEMEGPAEKHSRRSATLKMRPVRSRRQHVSSSVITASPTIVVHLAFLGLNAGWSIRRHVSGGGLIDGCCLGPSRDVPQGVDEFRSHQVRPGGVITVQDQWERFVEDVPPGEPPVLSRQQLRCMG